MNNNIQQNEIEEECVALVRGTFANLRLDMLKKQSPLSEKELELKCAQLTSIFLEKRTTKLDNESLKSFIKDVLESMNKYGGFIFSFGNNFHWFYVMSLDEIEEVMGSSKMFPDDYETTYVNCGVFDFRDQKNLEDIAKSLKLKKLGPAFDNHNNPILVVHHIGEQK